MCKPITQTLRDLAVGETVEYGIEKKSTLSTTIYSHLASERASGVRYSVKTDFDKGTVTVTRVA